MNSGDVIVIAVVALRLALDREAAPSFSVSSRGHIVQDPGLLALYKAPYVSSRGRQLLDIANQLIALAPSEICAILLGERRANPSRAPRVLALAGRNKQGKPTGGVKRANVIYPSTPRDRQSVDFVDLVSDDDVVDLVSDDIVDLVSDDDPMVIDQFSSLPELPIELVSMIFDSWPAVTRLRKNCISRSWEKEMLEKVTELESGLFMALPPALLKQLKNVAAITLVNPMARAKNNFVNLLLPPEEEEEEEEETAEPKPLPLTNLRQLFLRVTHPEEASTIVPHLTSLTALERLSVQTSELAYITWPELGFTNSILRDLGRTLTNLVELYLPSVLSPRLARPEIITKFACLVDATVDPDYFAPMTQLAHLTLLISDDVAPPQILPLLYSLPQSLTDLVLPGDLVNQLYGTVGDQLPNLTHLEFAAWQHLQSMAKLSVMTRLTDLSIAIHVDPVHVHQYLAPLVNLRRFAVLMWTDEKVDIGTGLASLIARLPVLQELEVTSSTPGRQRGRLSDLQSDTITRLSLTRIRLMNAAVFLGRLGNLTTLQLVNCRFATDQQKSITLPATLTTLEVRGCVFSKGTNCVFSLPANLSALTLAETNSVKRNKRVVRVNRVLDKDAILKLHDLRFLHYTTYPVTRFRERNVIHGMLEYYANGNLHNLAPGSTVLLGPDAIPLRL